MSMDEQYECMARFANALDAFNQQLARSLRELEEKHDIVEPHWQDEMRKDYDSDWLPLQEHVSTYIKVEGPRYLEFLRSKLRLLERYLRGG